jgi:hypothetical protein
VEYGAELPPHMLIQLRHEQVAAAAAASAAAAATPAVTSTAELAATSAEKALRLRVDELQAQVLAERLHARALLQSVETLGAHAEVWRCAHSRHTTVRTS